MNKIALWLFAGAGGLAVGVGIVMLLVGSLPVFNVSLAGFGVALLCLGLMFWDKVKKCSKRA